jgi:hypothetical protein
LSQVRAQFEVVADATRQKLANLPNGDFEEDDETLENFVQQFQQVGGFGRGCLEGGMTLKLGHYFQSSST